MGWTQRQTYTAVKKNEPVVYFIADEEGYVKIGTATSARARLDGLQTAHRQELRIIVTTPGGHATETELQRRFKHAHVRGEWFRPTPDLVAFINHLGTGLDVEERTLFMQAVEQLRRACTCKRSALDLPEAPSVNGVHTQLELLCVNEYRVLIEEHVASSERAQALAQKYADECENRHGVQIDVEDYATETG